MLKKISLFIFLLAAGTVVAQEDCYDGIDNDADGDIDLNDDECDCAGFGFDTLESLIPNPSFEDMSCCPTAAAMLGCADYWEQASSATSDYFNLCGITAKPGHFPPMFPLPGAAGGTGYAGFYDQDGWQEYIGACLLSPLNAGTTYVLNLWMAWGSSGTDLDFALYGTTDCADLPWFDFDCPIGEGDWQLLDETSLSFTTDGAWQEVTLTFTPAVDIYAVCMGGNCDAPASWNYFYVDELVLLDSSSFSGGGDIFTSGSYCEGDLMLNVDIDTFGGDWQWFYEGVALVGETGSTLDPMATGPGTYQAVYTLGADCEEFTYSLEVPDIPEADFTFSDMCDGEAVDFTDNSTVGSGAITEWDWDLGDATGSSILEDFLYTYSGPGTYTVELIVTTSDGCKDTVEQDVTIFPVPNAEFEFEINGQSSADGATGGCIANPLTFTDLSTIGGGGSIVGWDWSFGDGGTSTATDPTHTYDAPGTYTVTLEVTSDNGCTDVYTFEVIMTDAAELDVIFNSPSCYGFTDGSVTADIEGGDSPTIEITNAAGDLLNTGGSNTANTLGGGWYYIWVDDGTGCTAEAAVFLEEPGPLGADLDLTFPLCHGDYTGTAVVDEVFNAQGDLNNITFIWNPDPPAVSGLNADSIWSLGAGTYTLTINDDNGCSNEIEFEITQPDELVFNELGFDPAYCRLFPYQSGNGVVYAAAGGGTPDYEYEWCGPAGPDEDCTSSTTWGGRNPGFYTITITDDNGCILTQTIKLDSLNPIADFDVVSNELNSALEGTAVVCAEYINQSENFANPNNPFADTTFWWTMDNGNASWILSKDYFETFDTCYADGGTYEVCLMVQNKNGCVDTTCKTITVFTPLDFTPINIFTPDGDGINDVFTFTHVAKGVKTFHCTVVNRWGVTMAEIDDINSGWDGTDRNGSVVTDGVYFYVYEGEAENGNPFSGQGTIHLVAHGK